MLILKDFKLVNRKNSVQKFEDLYCGDVLIGYVTENIFRVQTLVGTDLPFVYPYMFKWELRFGAKHNPIFYASTVEDCRNIAIEMFREFVMAILR